MGRDKLVEDPQGYSTEEKECSSDNTQWESIRCSNGNRTGCRNTVQLIGLLMAVSPWQPDHVSLYKNGDSHGAETDGHLWEPDSTQGCHEWDSNLVSRLLVSELGGGSV